MDLKLYDTLSREKRVFTPIDPARVRMYVCGPTVYDYAHIGNARPVIVFDVLFRLLKHLAKQGTWDGGKGATEVVYVRNITDVDDKINARAAEEYPNLPLNEAIREVTNRTDKQFHDDVAALGCLAPTVEPRATEHIAEMKELIERLVKSGNAYIAEEHVLFSVPSMSDYGKLSKRPLEEMIAGARVDVAAYKRNDMDFVLWKPSKPGEPAWPSPAGIKTPGRPGWHIECSAMSWKHLGETFDIHGGGIDLVFPHHENEIAQSRCAFHTPVMANYWMHNGFLQVEGEKMSKSEGNFVTIRDLLHNWHGEVLRFQMLSTHYRQPIDWTTRRSEELENELWQWVTVLGRASYEISFERLSRAMGAEQLAPSNEIVEALSDDLNTPEAITALRGSYKRARDGYESSIVQFLRDCEFLGLLRPKLLHVHDQGVMSIGGVGIDYEDKVRSIRISVANNLPDLRKTIDDELRAKGIGADISIDGFVSLVPITEAAKKAAQSFDEKVQSLISARNAARKAKDFKESDRIRDELAAMGVVLKDSKDGTTWEIAR